MSLAETSLKPTSARRTGSVRVPLDASGPCPAGAPVSFGVPISRGEFTQVSRSALVTPDGERHAVQVQVTDRWADGSVRWVMADALLPRLNQDRGGLSLELAVTDSNSSTDPSLSSADGHPAQDSVAVTAGSRRFVIAGEGNHLLQIAADDGPLGLGRIVLRTEDGRRRLCDFQNMNVECRGAVREVVRLEGSFGGKCPLRVVARLSLYRGASLVKLDVTVHSPRRARHRGGIWDLGDAGSVLFRELALVLDLRHGPRRIECRPTRRDPVVTATDSDLKVYQDSSGGENWRSANHVSRRGEVPCRFRGYRITTASGESDGLRAESIVAVRDEQTSLHVAMPEFWQQFPKCLSVEGDGLRVGLFPGEFGDLHEVQGGEQKSHTVWLQIDDAAGRADEVTSPLSWVFNRPMPRPSSDWNIDCGLLPDCDGAPAEAVERFEGYLAESLDVLLANRERVDEYGWRNFGEIFADHEQQFYEGAEPLVSHYNNQFDMVQGFLLQSLRTGDERWWQLGDQLARHVMDIDLYHTREDRAAYSGGLFWFTDHYLHAKTSTHRTYSRANAPAGRPYGGGPSAEHNFTSGLLLYHRLTGSPDAKAAVIGLADWVIRRDDGTRSIFGVVDDGPTGLATASGDPNYHGPGRAGGNSVNALLDAWTVTADRRYLDHAERLIRRCVHPDDDVAALQLLDVEKRWSYTVFLAALLKYLRLKAEADQLDRHHAYAQASLLRYATWMRDNERPYFDQREKLEYPTEAWAAQEFRKANVLRCAAAHADEPLATTFWDRGRELADRAWRDLLDFETRTTARALAIVMVEGLTDLGLRAGRQEPAPRASNSEVDSEFPRPAAFVSQRSRVKSLLKSPRGLGLLASRAVNPARWIRYAKRRGCYD